jgi:hypothetical protein
MRAYFLTSPRLGFSTWSHDDLPLAMDLWGDPNVTRLTGGHSQRHHHPLNDASRRLLQGLGFRYTRDEFYAPTGQIEPCYLLRSAT